MLANLKTVIKITTLSRAQIYRLEKRGVFPKRIQLGEHGGSRRVAWLLAELEQFVAQRASTRSRD